MYDLIIIGAGPAGLTASIYASCYHLLHLVIGKELGGQLNLAPDILNYPGFENVSGKELSERMEKQVKLRGGEIIVNSVTKISAGPVTQVSQTPLQNRPAPNGAGLKASEAAFGSPSFVPPAESVVNSFEIETLSGEKYQAKAIILATGTERRKLNVPGEVEYTSKGVHYCATCEKFDYAGKICAVVGGANSAVQAAVEISQAAAKVYIIYRGRELRGDPVWLEQVDKHPNIEVIYGSYVSEIMGDGEKVTGVKLKPAGPAAAPVILTNNQILPLDKIFVEIGGVPGTALVIPLGVEVDAGGFIKTDAKLATNVPGVFAAGDLVTFGYNLEQISSAVGLGARAASSAFAYLKGERIPTVWGASQIKR